LLVALLKVLRETAQQVEAAVQAALVKRLLAVETAVQAVWALYGLVALEPIMAAEVEAVLKMVLLRVLVAWEEAELALLARAVPEPQEPQTLVAAAAVLDGQERTAQQGDLV